jgi:hypothetical protein
MKILGVEGFVLIYFVAHLMHWEWWLKERRTGQEKVPETK